VVHGVQGKCWKMLVDHELENNQLSNAIALFSDCLLKCNNMPLWLSYMQFIKMVRSWPCCKSTHAPCLPADHQSRTATLPQ
jgi:hypothetical protein